MKAPKCTIKVGRKACGREVTAIRVPADPDAPTRYLCRQHVLAEDAAKQAEARTAEILAKAKARRHHKIDGGTN